MLLEPVNDWFLELCKTDPLVAGQWNRWYREAIPLAEQRYTEYRAAKEKD